MPLIWILNRVNALMYVIFYTCIFSLNGENMMKVVFAWCILDLCWDNFSKFFHKFPLHDYIQKFFTF